MVELTPDLLAGSENRNSHLVGNFQPADVKKHAAW